MCEAWHRSRARGEGTERHRRRTGESGNRTDQPPSVCKRAEGEGSCHRSHDREHFVLRVLMAMFRRGNNHRNSTEVEAHAPGGNRGIPSGSGSIAGCTTASRMALRGGVRIWIHTSTPTSFFTGRRGRLRSQDDVMVAPYEFYPWPRPAHGMSRVLVRLCNARGRLPQAGRFRRDWVAPGRLVKFQKRGEICLA